MGELTVVNELNKISEFDLCLQYVPEIWKLWKFNTLFWQDIKYMMYTHHPHPLIQFVAVADFPLPNINDYYSTNCHYAHIR